MEATHFSYQKQNNNNFTSCFHVRGGVGRDLTFTPEPCSSPAAASQLQPQPLSAAHDLRSS